VCDYSPVVFVAACVPRLAASKGLFTHIGFTAELYIAMRRTEVQCNIEGVYFRKLYKKEVYKVTQLI